MVVCTVIDVIHYILKEIGPTEKIKLIKLTYLADKYHLIKYGRTITNDKYFAMEFGPVGSKVDEVLGFKEGYLSKEEINYAKRLIDKINDFTYEAKDLNIDYDTFAETDIEALNFIISKFGKEDQWKLMEYTHKYPEWKQHEESLKTKRISREEIKISELISVLDDNVFNISEDHIEESKALLSGQF